MAAKLPTISIPTFDGDPSDWAVFWDLFKSARAKEGKLTNSDKLIYL